MATYAQPLTSASRTSPQGFLRVFNKVFTQTGVIEPDAMEVSAQLTPDMSVMVSGSAHDDNAVFKSTDGIFIQAWNTQNERLDIESNNSGVTKEDAIVAYIDLEGGSVDNPNNTDALKFVAVRRSGTNTGEPTQGDIEGVVGIDNPYLVRAIVQVENGADRITSGNISNKSVQSRIAKEVIEPLGPSQIDMTEVLKKVYPVGSIYTNSANSTNPSSLLGFGSWVEFGKGRVMVGYDSGQSEFNSAEKLGGSKTHAHSLSSNVAAQIFITGSGNAISNYRNSPTSWTQPGGRGISGTTRTDTDSQSGGSPVVGDTNTSSSLQPYITVYMWKRTV